MAHAAAMLCGLIALLGAWDTQSQILFFAAGGCALIILGVLFLSNTCPAAAPLMGFKVLLLMPADPEVVPVQNLYWYRSANYLGVPPSPFHQFVLKATLTCL